ncbi:MAG: ZIP family metal transporter [Phycisphaerales bacterium]
MDPELLNLLLVTLIAATLADLSMILGVLPFFVVRDLSPRLSAIATAGAAGMMAAASLTQLTGEGLSRAPGLGAWEVAAGLAAGAGFYTLAATWIRDHDDFDVLALRKTGGLQSIMIVAVMFIHSIPEGIAIGVAFGSGETGLGASVVSALAVHNVPEAMAITLALRANGVGLWKCMGWALLTSLPQPIAAPIAAWMIWLFEPLLPFGLGLAAGAMTFLVVDEMLPESLERAGRQVVAGAFMVGVVLMIFLGRLVEIDQWWPLIG